MVRTSILIASFLVFCTPAAAQTTDPPTPPEAAQTAGQETAVPPGASVLSLFLDLGNDFKHLPSRETALILGVAGGLSLAAQREDADITRSFSGSETIEEVLEPGEFGGGALQIAAAAGTYALGRGFHNPHISLVGADLIRSQIVNGALTQAIKLAVDRQRPDGRRYSFPSGHVSSSMATAAVLQRHFGWRLGIPAYALAGMVGGSRLQLNRHYLSDEIFGAAIGLVAGRTTTIGRGRANFAITPFADNGTAGIGFVLVPQR